MKQTTFYFLGLVCVLLLAACQAPPVETAALDMEAIKTEIQAMEDAFAASINAKNLDGQTAYYADDAQSLSPNKPTLVGKEAILANAKAQMEKDSTSNNTVSFEITDIYAEGDLLVEVGKSITTKADGSKETGKYISIFEKRDGKYVCIRDIYNDDQKESSDEEDSQDDSE